MKKQTKAQPRPVVEPICVGVKEAGVMINRSRDAIYALLNSGQLRSIKSGKRRTIPIAEIRKYVARMASAVPPSETRKTRIDGQKRLRP